MKCSIPGSLSFTISQSLLKFMSNESVMPSNYLILWHPLLLLSSNFPSIRVFSNEWALPIRTCKSLNLVSSGQVFSSWWASLVPLILPQVVSRLLLPWLKTVWIHPLELRDGHGGKKCEIERSLCLEAPSALFGFKVSLDDSVSFLTSMSLSFACTECRPVCLSGSSLNTDIFVITEKIILMHKKISGMRNWIFLTICLQDPPTS